MRRIVNDEALDVLFRAAAGGGGGARDQTGHGWLARPVSDTMLRAIWELVKLGPASGTGPPVRIAFVCSVEAKAQVASAAALHQDRATIAAAPVAAIISARLPERASAAAGNAVRDGAMCAAYLILAARALGLDCVPIWHFDASAIERAISPIGGLGAGFLCALGYRDDAHPQRQPRTERRPGLDEACTIL